MFVEKMESRRLMSVSFDVPNKAITITGENDFPGDNISAKVENGILKISDNGASFQVTSSAVKTLYINTGDGSDNVLLEPSVTQRAIVHSGGTTFSFPETIQTGSGNDIIYADIDSDLVNVSAGAGDDYLYNEGFQNSLDGESGNDHLVNLQGQPTDGYYTGGTGYDVIDYSSFANGVVLRNGGSGIYQTNEGMPVIGDDGVPVIDGAQSTDSIDGMEAFYAGSGKDYVYGDENSNLIRGNGGADHLYGGGGNDFLYGGTGADYIYGEGGNDQLFSKGDNTKDFLFGGSGTDKAQKDAIDVVNSVEGTIA